MERTVTLSVGGPGGVTGERRQAVTLESNANDCTVQTAIPKLRRSCFLILSLTDVAQEEGQRQRLRRHVREVEPLNRKGPGTNMPDF
jgi:hypothetical protein